MTTSESKKAVEPGKTVLGDDIRQLMLQPFVSMTRARQLTQQSVMDLLAVNRGLADQMQSLFRRSRDLAQRVSETTVARASASAPMTVSVAELNEVYDFAVSAIREVTDATLAAQLKSFELLTGNALAMMNGSAEAKTAPSKAGD